MPPIHRHSLQSPPVAATPPTDVDQGIAPGHRTPLFAGSITFAPGPSGPGKPWQYPYPSGGRAWPANIPGRVNGVEASGHADCGPSPRARPARQETPGPVDGRRPRRGDPGRRPAHPSPYPVAVGGRRYGGAVAGRIPDSPGPPADLGLPAGPGGLRGRAALPPAHAPVAAAPRGRVRDARRARRPRRPAGGRGGGGRGRGGGPGAARPRGRELVPRRGRARPPRRPRVGEPAGLPAAGRRRKTASGCTPV